MIDIPWWGWFLIGIFVGMGLQILCAIIIIWLRNRDTEPLALQYLDNKLVRIYSIGKDGGTHVVKFRDDEE